MLVSLLCACSSSKPATPTVAEQQLQPSGGVSGGALGDSLTVFAIDAATNQGIAGARVLLGNGADARDVGLTDAQGKLVISGLGAAPAPQTVSVSYSGYTSASWVGVSSAAVTLPLALQTAQPTTTVTASITGYENLPVLPAGHYRSAAFAPSLPVQLDTLEVESALSASCPASSGGTSCQVTIANVPTSTGSMLAVVVEGDDHGTPNDTSDDTLTMTNLGVATGLALNKGNTVEVSLLSADLLAQATISIGPNAVGQDVIGVPGVTLGNQVILYPALGGQMNTFLVPTAAGAMSGAKLWAVATAKWSAAAPTERTTTTTGAAWSRVYARGISSPSVAGQSITISTEGFLGEPSVQVTNGSYALSGSSALARLEFTNAGIQQLDVLLLPGQTSFTPPAALALTADRVDALSFDVSNLDARSFTFGEIIEQAARIAYTDVALSSPVN